MTPSSKLEGRRNGGTEYAVADPKGAVLTERDTLDAPGRVVPRRKWRFTNDRAIALGGNFVPDKVYEIVYTATDPAVAGTGLAAVRDFVAWAKHDPSSPIPEGFTGLARFESRAAHKIAAHNIVR